MQHRLFDLLRMLDFRSSGIGVRVFNGGLSEVLHFFSDDLSGAALVSPKKERYHVSVCHVSYRRVHDSDLGGADPA